MRTIVVLPTYQEAENIARVLGEVLASPVSPDVLVVDDSSPDGTGDIVRRLATGLPAGRVRLLTRATKDGLGAAYRAGFAEALALGYEAVVQMDADGSHPVGALEPMAAALEAGADLVLASRYVPGGGVDPQWPWYRRLLSRGGNVYARLLLRSDVTDLTGGYKMWRAELLGRLDLPALTATGYAFQIQTTLAARELGARTAQVPILFTERAHGSSKMSRAIVAEAMVAVLRMRRRGASGTSPR
ncbi:polyprenol monophosphomannose synthase [Kineococcus sp. NUM-3379]